MQKVVILSTALTLSAATMVAEARTSSPSDYRGLQNCLAAAEATSNGLVPAREYLIEKDGSKAWFYINATRWQDGQRDAVRIACQTERGGKKLVSASIEPGRFVNSSSELGLAQQ